MDLSKAFAKAVRLYWPKEVAIVHDHYHIVSNMNDVVDRVRRDEQNRLKGEGKRVVKGLRYLLLRAGEKVNAKNVLFRVKNVGSKIEKHLLFSSSYEPMIMQCN